MGKVLSNEVLMNELNTLISGFLESKNLELIDLIYRPDGKRMVLTVLADKPQGGITLQECALFCRQLKNLLEEKNIIEGDYVLEVSSPGLDRCLTGKKDFLRSLNKQAVFYLSELINGKCEWRGLIAKVEAESVFIDNSGSILEIPLTKINKAQLII